MKSPLRLFFTPLGVPYQGEKGGLGAALTAEGVSQDRCNSSLGERALGCGRWTCALTEASQSDVRSLMRAPLGRSVKRGESPNEPRDLRCKESSAEGLEVGGGVPLDEMFAPVDHVDVETGIALLGQAGPFRRRAAVLLAVDEEHRDRDLIQALP